MQVKTRTYDSKMEKNDMEVLVRTQDGCEYTEFALPLRVYDAKEWNENEAENRHGYVLAMFYTCIGEFKEEKHAIHVMNYLLAQRNHYMFDNVKDIKSVILNVPSDELVRETPDENLLDGIPVVKEKTEADND